MPHTMRYAVIMAGGSGTRLWPMSRKARPKQLLPLIGGRSLLELAFERLEGVVPVGQRLVCAGEIHRQAILTAIPQLDPQQYLGEPIGRDSVNAVGFTAAVLAKTNPNAVFAVLTADHLIEPHHEFRKAFELGFALVESDPNRFVTFSIKPSHPATNYGYVERGQPIAEFPGAFRAARFAEKPDLATAQQFVQSGKFNWNSGMFVFNATTFMNALSWYLPENARLLNDIAHAWQSDRQTQVLEQVYPQLHRISVDYGVMEPASSDPQKRIEICTAPMNVSWMDVGSWPSYGATLNPDEQSNRSNAATAHLSSRNILAVSDDPHHTIAAVDCQDLIIVHTVDATLVCPSASAERIKELAQQIPPKLR